MSKQRFFGKVTVTVKDLSIKTWSDVLFSGNSHNLFVVTYYVTCLSADTGLVREGFTLYLLRSARGRREWARSSARRPRSARGVSHHIMTLTATRNRCLYTTCSHHPVRRQALNMTGIGWLSAIGTELWSAWSRSHSTDPSLNRKSVVCSTGRRTLI